MLGHVGKSSLGIVLLLVTLLHFGADPVAGQETIRECQACYQMIPAAESYSQLKGWGPWCKPCVDNGRVPPAPGSKRKSKTCDACDISFDKTFIGYYVPGLGELCPPCLKVEHVCSHCEEPIGMKSFFRVQGEAACGHECREALDELLKAEEQEVTADEPARPGPVADKAAPEPKPEGSRHRNVIMAVVLVSLIIIGFVNLK